MLDIINAICFTAAACAAVMVLLLIMYFVVKIRESRESKRS